MPCSKFSWAFLSLVIFIFFWQSPKTPFLLHNTFYPMKLAAKLAAYLFLSLPIFTSITVITGIPKTMSTQPTTIKDSAINSEDFDREISDLTSEIKVLSDSANRWNSRYLWALGFSVGLGGLSIILGIGTVVFQYLALRDNRDASTEQVN